MLESRSGISYLFWACVTFFASSCDNLCFFLHFFRKSYFTRLCPCRSLMKVSMQRYCRGTGTMCSVCWYITYMLEWSKRIIWKCDASSDQSQAQWVSLVVFSVMLGLELWNLDMLLLWDNVNTLDLALIFFFLNQHHNQVDLFICPGLHPQIN